MSCISRDLTIEEALADPVIGAAMRADRVDPLRFETLLRSTARRLGPDRPALPGSSLARSVLAAAGCRPSPGVTAAW